MTTNFKKKALSKHPHTLTAHSPHANTHSLGLDMGLKAMICKLFSQGGGGVDTTFISSFFLHH